MQAKTKNKSHKKQEENITIQSGNQSVTINYEGITINSEAGKLHFQGQ